MCALIVCAGLMMTNRAQYTSDVIPTMTCKRQHGVNKSITVVEEERKEDFMISYVGTAMLLHSFLFAGLYCGE